MRVVHVAPTPFGEGGVIGGGERYPLELARAVARHVPTELVTFARRPARTVDGTSPLRVTTLRAWTWLRGHPAYPLAPSLLTALGGADVVHAHQLHSLPAELSLAIARARGIARAATDHGLPGSDRAGLLPALVQRFLPVSAHSAELMGAPPDRTRIIHGGADPDRYRPDPAQARDGVAFVGRISPHKGIDVLIRALPAGARLRVAGAAPPDLRPPESAYPEDLRRLAAERGADVAFQGALDDGAQAALLRASRVLVLPSVHRTMYGRGVAIVELLGLVVLEAMASGTPVVCSRVGGVPEIVEDGVNGFLVDAGDDAQLRDRLATLLADPALAERMGRRGRDMVLDRYTWDHCARRCLAAYEEIV